MSDFPPGSSAAANAKSPAYADALLRARQVRTSIRYIITSIFLDDDILFTESILPMFYFLDMDDAVACIKYDFDKYAETRNRFEEH